MQNMTMDTWLTTLSGVAADHGADDGADGVSSDGSIGWTSDFDFLKVRLMLDINPRSMSMSPSVKIGSSRTAPRDTRDARAMLRAGLRAIDAAEGAMVGLRGAKVWLRDCPCDSCRGTGLLRPDRAALGDCPDCDGTGYIGPRSPEEPA